MVVKLSSFGCHASNQKALEDFYGIISLWKWLKGRPCGPELVDFCFELQKLRHRFKTLTKVSNKINQLPNIPESNFSTLLIAILFFTMSHKFSNRKKLYQFVTSKINKTKIQIRHNPIHSQINILVFSKICLNCPVEYI